MAGLVHLHVHTDASLKDGLGTVERLVSAAKEKGFRALAMTDHGTLANTIAFINACKEANLKAIIGLEAYVRIDNTISHMTLLADGNEGFNNLVKLNNIGHASENKSPAFMLDDLFTYNNGLVLLSGCVASPLNSLSEKDAKGLVARIKGVFGERFFIETMLVGGHEYTERMLKYSRDWRIPLVVTNDVHFPYKEDAEIHPILTMMKAKFSYESSSLWLKDKEDILALADKSSSKQILDGLETSIMIAKRIRQMRLSKTPQLPHIDNPDALLEHSLASYNAKADVAHRERLIEELSTIKSMGYSSYFCILHDIINYAKSKGVRIGAGRGSGAGSLVLYALGVTSLDPLTYNLSFERFLNKYRVGMPDVDVDFDSEHRQLVIKYAEDKWKAIPIATYSKYAHKSLVHDLGKVLKLPYDQEHEVAETGPDGKEMENLRKKYPLFSKSYDAMIGQIRHKGKHAGGVIITNAAVPIERAGDEKVAAWTEGENTELSQAGIVKFDLLSLSALSVLKRLENKFGIRAPNPVDCDPAFKLFRYGDLAGIFQFSGSAGIRKLCMQLKPDAFEDLIAINALYRPGALDVGATARYPEWKKNPRVVPDIIKDILEPTYGAIVYQEQVMAIYARITGVSIGEADIIRRVIIKAKPGEGEVDKLRETFMASAEKCMSKKESMTLWDEIFAHSRYSFNRAHAASYAYVAWEMAWWKYNHKAAFYSEMLNVDPTEAQTYILAVLESGIKINLPSLHNPLCEYSFDEEETTICMPLTAIKYISKPTAQLICKKHKESSVPISDAKYFMLTFTRSEVRAQARFGLLAIGAFDGDITASAKMLGIKDEKVMELHDSTRFTREKEYLGVIIPTKENLQIIKKYSKPGYLAGIVTERKQKTSKYGEYFVYNITPYGVFWSRDHVLEVGTFIVVEVKDGKALKIHKV